MKLNRDFLGRMVLLVTTLLSLVTMFDTVRNNSPDALELKSIEVRRPSVEWRLRKFLLNSEILTSGLAVVLHVFRVPRLNGVFCRAVWNSLRLSLAKIAARRRRSTGPGASPATASKSTSVALSNTDCGSEPRGTDDHFQSTER
jgi:hypothetical protein